MARILFLSDVGDTYFLCDERGLRAWVFMDGFSFIFKKYLEIYLQYEPYI